MDVRPYHLLTELGLLPADWSVASFDEVCRRLNAKLHQVQTSEYKRVGSLPVVDQGQKAVVGYTDQLERKFECPEGGVIVFGDHTCIVKFVDFDFAVGADGTQLIVAKHGDVTRFHAYGLEHRSVVSTGYNRHFKFLRERLFVRPPYQEQRAIAEALSDVDALLAGLDRLIAKKRDLKQAAMQQLLTGQTRLPGFQGEWGVNSVADLENRRVVKLSRGQVISRRDIDATPGDFPIYSSSIHNDGLFGCYGKFMFDEELITWSVDGGGNFFHRRKHKFSVTNVCGFMRVDTSQIDCRFLAAQLQLLHSRKNFDYQSKAHPSVIRKEYEVQLPLLPEQRAIATVLSDMDAELTALEARRDKTRLLKQGMMQELLTGRTRLV
jgi:type I restriction enzyme S subunit